MTIRIAIANDTPAASYGSKISAMSGSPTAPMRIENAVTPSCDVAMNLTGSSSSRTARRARRLPVRELAQARAARGDERVLGRDEVRVPQHEQENRDELQRVLTPLPPGRRY